MLSFKSLYTRTTGQAMTLSRLKSTTVAEAKTLYEHPANQLIAQVHKEHIEGLTQSIQKIEKVVLNAASALPYYPKLKTLPGVGIILGLTIHQGQLRLVQRELARALKRISAEFAESVREPQWDTTHSPRQDQ